MSEIPKATVELSLVSKNYPDSSSIVEITISGRKQSVDQIFQVLSEKFDIIDHGGERVE